MKLMIKKGATSVRVPLFIQNNSVTTGAGLTGLTSSSSGLTCYRYRQDDGNAGGVQLTLTTATLGSYTSGGFVEKDSTHLPGVYELGLDTGGLATGSDTVLYMLQGATNMAPCVLEIQLVAFDPDDAVHLGLSSLPNAAAAAAGGLLTFGSSTGQINPTSGNVPITQTFPTNFSSLSITGGGLVSIGTLPTNFSSLSIDSSGRVTIAPQQLVVKKDTALANFTFFLRKSLDGITGLTGATVTAQRSIDGGALASCTNAVSEVGSGLYVINLSAADLNGGVITLLFTATGAVPTPITIPTQP